jgi:hypothetical protein
MRARWLLLYLAAVTACGGQATAPSRVVITTIEYQRVYTAAGGGNGERMLINVSLPESKSIPFCTPAQQTTTSFVCTGLNWEIRKGEEASIWVNDPVLNRGVATTLFVNGTPISRVEVLSNGNEMGRFRLSNSGRFE